MNGRGRSSRKEQGIVIVAGEDTNDRKIITLLLRSIRSDSDLQVAEIRDSVRLKNAAGGTLTRRIRTLVQKAKAQAERKNATLSGLVVHEDLDGVTDAKYTATRARVATALEHGSPCPTALALAAWETEAWLLLFPGAFTKVHKGWTVPRSLAGKDTGALTSPKEVLQRKLGSPKFREGDGPRVMSAACLTGLSTVSGSNRSYADFIGDLARWS